MAIPTNHQDIQTNLSSERLKEILAAIESKEVTWIPETGGMFAELREGLMEYDGARYRVQEISEIIYSIHLVD